MTCLDDNTLAAFLGGDLTADQRAEALRHLEACTTCAQLVAAVQRGDGAEPQGLSTADTLSSPGVAQPTQPPPRIGRYLILKHLGSGGMGSVYQAYDPVLERKVAVKLVRAGRSPASAAEVEARLQREGKLVAQLSHPNVVSVFDMGTSDDEVFVAMELVDGGSLRQWLRERPRPWSEVLSALLDAGRGLAAAHRAGLVHRDFKPDNVLMGTDGRARVSDFGLSSSMTPDEALASMGSAEARLTQSGAVLGTPAYMAPEQWSGSAVDARADQFSFCLSAWEALYRSPPFLGGPGRPSWVRVEAPPSPVPASVRVALERGLSVDASKRFPSMDALLAALEAHRARRPQRLVVVVAASAAALVLGGAALWHSRTRCSGAPALAQTVWNPRVASELEQALGAVGEPDAARRARRALDAYVEGWVAMHTDACEATRVRGEQSDQVLTLRMSCLERRRAEVGALVGLLQAATAELAGRAPDAVEAMTPLATCADTEGLLATVAPPRTPAIAQQVEALRHGLAEAKALLDLGRYAEGVARAESVTREARAVDYPPVLAEALALWGRGDELKAELKAAEEHLLDAVSTAEAAKHDVVRAAAATTLVVVLGVRQARYAEAQSWDKLAAGAIARVGGGAWLEAPLLQARGQVLYALGKPDEAIEVLRRAVEAFARVDPKGVARSLALNELGAAYRGARQLPEALETYGEALELLRQRLGDDSDAVAASRNGLANTLMLEGRFPEAQAMYETALAVFEKRLGPRHYRTVTGYNNLGVVLAEQERYQEALPYFEKVVAARDATAADPRAADAHANLAMLLIELGRNDEAQAKLQRAEALLQGVALDHFSHAEPLLGRARLALERRDGGSAQPALERVLALCEEKQGFRFDYTRARAEFLMARLLAETKGREDEGRALAEKVKATFEGLGARRFQRDLAVVSRWLEKRPPPALTK